MMEVFDGSDRVRAMLAGIPTLSQSLLTAVIQGNRRRQSEATKNSCSPDGGRTGPRPIERSPALVEIAQSLVEVAQDLVEAGRASDEIRSNPAYLQSGAGHRNDRQSRMLDKVELARSRPRLGEIGPKSMPYAC